MNLFQRKQALADAEIVEIAQKIAKFADMRTEGGVFSMKFCEQRKIDKLRTSSDIPEIFVVDMNNNVFALYIKVRTVDCCIADHGIKILRGGPDSKH